MERFFSMENKDFLMAKLTQGQKPEIRNDQQIRPDWQKTENRKQEDHARSGRKQKTENSNTHAPACRNQKIENKDNTHGLAEHRK